MGECEKYKNTIAPHISPLERIYILHVQHAVGEISTISLPPSIVRKYPTNSKSEEVQTFALPYLRKRSDDEGEGGENVALAPTPPPWIMKVQIQGKI